VSRGFKILAVVFLVFFLALFIPGSGALADSIFALLFGWIRFAGQVLPKVTVNPAGVGMALGCVALAAVVGHRFCLWLRQGEPWRWRWTLAGLSGILILFAAGMAFTGVAHQVGWLMRSPKPLWIHTGSNERSPSASLKTVASAQADFRGNDRDGNRIQDFWRADIAGLYAVKPPESEEMIKLIELSVAAADGRPATSVATFAVPAPKMGYWYRALRFKDETEPDPNRFAAIAYPDSPSAGAVMYVISHENTIFFKPAEVPVPDVYPEDPLKEGWSKLD